MNIKIHAPDLKLTEPIADYIEKRMKALEKFLGKESAAVLVEVEVGKVSHRHRQGEVYRAEINLSMPGRQLRSEAEEADVYTAVDVAKDEMERELTSTKDKERTLFRRGAVVVKDLVKGFGKFKWRRFPKLPRFPRWKK
ncbi:ribosome-associated translation inhibitor RaiA [Candidatus Parcubacteria bacterium]|nr:ribosome-associated translation inhibitor RaiA [Candidatus Parcubacteria bacterium]